MKTRPFQPPALRFYRTRAQETQQQIAFDLGMNRGTYSRIEQGRIEIKGRHLLALSKRWKVPAHNLLQPLSAYCQTKRSRSRRRVNHGSQIQET